MKRVFLLLSSISLTAAFLSSFTSSAPRTGDTGSPGDQSNCTRCHRGTAMQDSTLITTDIPKEGYEPGKKYNITFSISDSRSSKFGFQMTSEDSQNNNKGSFESTSNTTAQNGGTHISHVTRSTGGTGTKSWTVPWTAPSKGTGDVTFYGAGNASNGNSMNTGDAISLGSFKVQERSLVSLAKVQESESFRLYPNPVRNVINVVGTEHSYRIYSISGELVQSGEIEANNTQVNVEELQRGVYFYKTNNDQEFVRFVKL